MANQYLDLGMEPIVGFLKENGLIDESDLTGRLMVRCPLCGNLTMFDRESQVKEMLIICMDLDCPWSTRLGPLRTAVLVALHERNEV